MSTESTMVRDQDGVNLFLKTKNRIICFEDSGVGQAVSLIAMSPSLTETLWSCI